MWKTASALAGAVFLHYREKKENPAQGQSKILH